MWVIRHLTRVGALLQNFVVLVDEDDVRLVGAGGGVIELGVTHENDEIACAT